MYYLQNRYFDPTTARWLNTDRAISGIGGNILGYNLFQYCFNNPMNMSDASGNWPKWVETAAKIATAVVTVAAVAVMAYTVASVATGAIVGAAAVKAVTGASVFLGAALSGINGGVANEAKGNSYANGYVGGATGGAIQAVSSKTPGGTIVGGGVGVGVGTVVTDVLNNLDPDSANSSGQQIINNAASSGLKALATSSVTAFIGVAAGGINYQTGMFEGAMITGCDGLMPGFTPGFGESIKAFFGAVDDALVYLWE